MARFDLNLLGALHALLHDKNVTRAAERLHVTQPTMSGMLQRLRYQFGDDLLVRNGRVMELTSFAASLIEPVTVALQSIEQLVRAEPVFDPRSSTRKFTISASDYCTSLFLSHVIARAAILAPGIRLVISPINAPLERLMSGDSDLCICTDDLSLLSRSCEFDRLQFERLFTDEFVCVVERGSPIDETSTLQEILSYPHVGVEIPGTMNTIGVASFTQLSPDYKPRYVVADFPQVAPVVARTKAVGLIQRRLAEQAVATLPLRMFRPPFAIPQLRETMIWHSRGTGDPAHAWLRSMIRDVAQDFAAESIEDAPKPLAQHARALRVA